MPNARRASVLTVFVFWEVGELRTPNALRYAGFSDDAKGSINVVRVSDSLPVCLYARGMWDVFGECGPSAHLAVKGNGNG